MKTESLCDSAHFGFMQSLHRADADVSSARGGKCCGGGSRRKTPDRRITPGNVLFLLGQQEMAAFKHLNPHQTTTPTVSLNLKAVGLLQCVRWGSMHSLVGARACVSERACVSCSRCKSHYLHSVCHPFCLNCTVIQQVKLKYTVKTP